MQPLKTLGRMVIVGLSINNYWEPTDVGFILNETFSFCKDREIDIIWQIEQKMKYNELRLYKHSKLY